MSTVLASTVLANTGLHSATPGAVVLNTGVLSAYELARPSLLWALAIAAPLVLLHLVHRRRVRVEVPFLGLLREGMGPTREAARFKRLRHWLSLLLRVGALALLVFALCGLRPAEDARPPHDLILVVDADVTTAVIEPDGRSRFEHGVALAEAHVAHHVDGAVRVLLAAEAPVLVAPAATSREALAKALAEMARTSRARREAVGDAPSYAPGLPQHLPARGRSALPGAWRAAALAARRSERPATIRMLTARPFVPPAGGGEALTTELVGTGQEAGDQTLADVQVAALAGGRSWMCRVQLRNDAPEPALRTVRARLEGETIFEESVELAPGGGAATSFQAAVRGEEGTWLTIELAEDDAFPVGDRVDAWLAPTPRPSVLVVHSGKARVGPLLVLDGLADAIDLRASGSVHIDDVLAAPPRDVTIVDGVALPEKALRPGAYLFIAPLAGALPFRLGPVLEKPLVWRTEEEHPVMRWLDFTAAEVTRAFSVTGSGQRPLAWADALPVAAEGERGGVRYIVLGLDPSASWMQVQVGFPLFLRRAIMRLAEGPVAALAPLYRAGAVLKPRAPVPGAKAVRVNWRDPRGGPRSRGASSIADLTGRGELWRVPVGAHGRATLTSGRGDEQWMGNTGFANLDPARSITPARAPGLAPEPRQVAAPAEPRLRKILLWTALALLLVDLLVRPAGARPRRGLQGLKGAERRAA